MRITIDIPEDDFLGEWIRVYSRSLAVSDGELAKALMRVGCPEFSCEENASGVFGLVREELRDPSGIADEVIAPLLEATRKGQIGSYPHEDGRLRFQEPSSRRSESGGGSIH